MDRGTKPMIDVSLIGLFVGGRGTRMGGAAKGLLRAPEDDRTLVARLVDESRGLAGEVLLVGTHEAYEALGLRALADAQAGAGPLGGLVSLLREARGGRVIALACDLPFIDRAFLERLACSAPEAKILAPRREHGWEPLAARYRSEDVLAIAQSRLARGALSLQGLLDEVGTTELVVEARERDVLDDWDTPEDMARPRPRR
ncbi:MAG: molybdenum cofactor guanylyltransferase [Sandaracinus sp.]